MARRFLVLPPTLPIFLASDEDADLMVAPTVAAAEAEMEPPEVSAGYYVVFDSAGHVGTLTIEKWSVTISGWSDEVYPSELRRRIQRYFNENSLGDNLSPDEPEFIMIAARVIADAQRKLLFPRKPNWMRRRRGL
jgi:hypothetical protein